MDQFNEIYEYIGFLHAGDDGLDLSSYENIFVEYGRSFLEKEKLTYETLASCKIPEEVLEAAGLHPKEKLEEELAQHLPLYMKYNNLNYKDLLDKGLSPEMLRKADLHKPASSLFNTNDPEIHKK